MVEYTTTAGSIAEACEGRIATGDSRTPVNTITTDSRELGRNNLFVPLIGEKFDGHDFIASLSEQKRIASYLTMKNGFTETAARNNITEIRCDDTHAALGAIAARHRNAMNARVIGITGTNGKTTTKELVYAILAAKMNCLKNIKNYNNEIGVPVTLMGLIPTHEIAVIEMGMNHSGELDRLSRIARPDLALITNVGEGHLEFLGSVENVALAKSEIMNGMKSGARLLVNHDMNCVNIIMESARKRGLSVGTFGLSKKADIHPDSYVLTKNSISLVFQGADISVPLYGIHNVYNIVAALAIGVEFDLSPADMKKALSSFVNVEGRSQIIDRGWIVIDDSYNSNPLSLQYALRSTGEIFPNRRKIAVLSDMKELGEAAASYHTECGKAVAGNGFDMLLVWGELAGYYADGAAHAGMKKGKIRKFENKNELSRFLSEAITSNDVILVKGSRSMKMEDVVRAITGRED